MHLPLEATMVQSLVAVFDKRNLNWVYEVLLLLDMGLRHMEPLAYMEERTACTRLRVSLRSIQPLGYLYILNGHKGESRTSNPKAITVFLMFSFWKKEVYKL